MEVFLMVRAVPGELLANVFEVSSESERRILMEHAGELAGRLHARGFFQHPRLKDLIRTPEGELTVIDRESGRPWPRRFSSRLAMTSLARTARRTLRDGHRLGPASASAFFEGYSRGLESRWPMPAADLARLFMRRFRRELRNR